MAKKPPKDDEPWLLEFPEIETAESEPLVSPISHPIWTYNKARLIEEYLRLFVYVTRHGTYIDGFAGPQRRENTEMWTARRVLESQTRPRRIRNYHLFEIDPDSYKMLETLKAELPQDAERTHPTLSRRLQSEL